MRIPAPALRDSRPDASQAGAALPRHTASSEVFQPVVIEIARRYPEALQGVSYEDVVAGFPTRSSYADGELLNVLRSRYVRRAGIARTFGSYVRFWTGQSYPALNMIVSAPDAVSTVRRLQAIEGMGPRIAITRLLHWDDTSITVEQHRHLDADARAPEYAIAYWGLLVGLLCAGGYRNLMLEAIDGERPVPFFVDDSARAAAMTNLTLMRIARVSWTHVEPTTPWAFTPVKTLGEHRLVAQLVHTVHAAIDDGIAPTLATLAAATHVSMRSVQRRLRAAWIGICDIRSAVRLQRATRLLIQRRISLSEIAHSAGYADAPHMVREFRRLVGIAPERYRELSRL